MVLAREILFLLCLPLLTYGQNLYHLRDDGVYDGSLRILDRDFSDKRVTMGFNGIDLFIAEGNFDAKSATIFRFPIDGTSGLTTFKTISSSYDITVDCCCQYVVYAYPDQVSGFYKIQLRSIVRDGISKDFVIRDLGLSIATVVLDCEAMPEEGADPSSANPEIIRVITQHRIYTFDIMATSPNNLPEITDIETLIAPPRCAAFWNDGVDEYLFTAYEDRDQIQVTTMKASFQSLDLIFTHTNHRLKTACVATNGDNLHLFSRHTSESEGYLITIPTQEVIDNNGGLIEVPTTGLVQFDNLQSVGDFVNGISVCDSCADNPCLTTVCAACTAPGFEICGFCSRDGDVCLCSEPSETGCSYDSPTLEDRCRRPIPKLDAHCVVYNPLANRRKKPGPIDVAVVVAAEDQSNFASATVTRAAKTGRWPVTNMPILELLLKNELMMYGILIDLQDKARGRRFGFFEAEVYRQDGLMDEIYCITSEKSAFTNEVFTYTVGKGESVTISVEMRNVEFLNQVKWRRTTLVTGDVEDLDNDGSLSLTYTNVNKEEHEGVYEAYRLRRVLRTWHPIVYLYVRSCTKDKYGYLCQSDCPDCGNGICDVTTGACRCHPGFTGTNCESACSSPDEIGQSCDISCSSIFPDAGIGDNCINLEICGAEDLGCACRSGLQPPDCIKECDAGERWGPNCSNTCDCGPLKTCDARIGCV